MTSLSVRDALLQGAERLQHLESGRRDAELLLLRILDRDRAWLLAHPEAQVAQEQIAQYTDWLTRRAAHEPVQYIVGEQEFWGLPLKVTPDVLIPRPETEHLVEAVLARIPATARARIADIGTGSGAIAIALARNLPQAQVTALDLSPAALRVAAENAAAHNLQHRIRFFESDLLEAVCGENFEAIVSNPPYIAAGEPLEPQVLNYEPHSALFAGPAGMDIYKRLVPQAWRALVPGGWLALEIGHGQKAILEDLLESWLEISFENDLQGIPRIALARKP